jgi:hypothetical protein
VHAKAVAGRPSCGGRRTTELCVQCLLGAPCRWQRLYDAKAIPFKDRSCTAEIEPSFSGRPRTSACLTLRCTRRATAGFASLRPRVNSDVRPHGRDSISL